MNNNYKKVFNMSAPDHMKANIFLDKNGISNISRYENVKYPTFENFTEKQLSFFWRAEEVDLSSDKSDFKNLPEQQQHIFISNIQRQILLDSVQRGINLTLLPISCLPEVEVWLETWGANETIHSRSYTHIIRNIFSNPSEIFDNITNVSEIIDCANDITKYYDNLIYHNTLLEMKNFNIKSDVSYNDYEHKKALWLCLNSINILEGIRFYVSFACSWNFAEQKKMEGNAKIIRLICRDENLHLGATQYMLKTLPKDDIDYEKIREDTKHEVQNMFLDCIQQEKDWAKYLFKNGSMIGLSEEILCNYIEYIGARRMKSLNLDINFNPLTYDPLPWTKNWISGKETQNAPQEVEISSYLVSDIKQDIDENLLNDLTL